MTMNVQGIDAKQPQKHHRLRSATIMTTGLVGGCYGGLRLCETKGGDKLREIADTFVDKETGESNLYNDVCSKFDFEKAKDNANLSVELKDSLKTLSELKGTKSTFKNSFVNGLKMGASFATISDSKELLEKENILKAKDFEEALEKVNKVYIEHAKTATKILGKYIGGGILAGGIVAFCVNKCLNHHKKEVKA